MAGKLDAITLPISRRKGKFITQRIVRLEANDMINHDKFVKFAKRIAGVINFESTNVGVGNQNMNLYVIGLGYSPNTPYASQNTATIVRDTYTQFYYKDM